MIKYNPLFKNDGTLNGALSTAPSDSIIFDLPGKCIWVKGVKLKGTDTTYTFSHDNYITLTNTPGDPEDIKIGVNTTALKNAIDTTYGIVSATVDGLAPKYNTTNKASTDFYSSVYCLGVAGSTLKWYQIPHRTVRINNDTNDKLTSNDGEPLRISAGTNIGVTWNSTTKSIVISNTATIPENTDSNVAQYIASDDNNYRILFKGTLNDDSVIWSTRFSSTLLYNPSTKVLSVNGNAVLHAGNVNSANATIGTSLTTIATIGGVDIKAQISNTDFKVTQTAVTTNSDYRVLLKKTANDKEETNSSNFASTLLYNPSTKELKINGNRVVTFADVYVGATSSANATTGLVPAATSANRNKFLRGDGTWLTIVQENTWRPIKVGGSEKLGSGTNTGAVDFVAGTGITLGWDATNKKITITNSAPDQNHNTDRTGIKLGTVSGTKKTDGTVILANSTVGLTIAGGTNKFSIGDGTNYIEVPITINHGLSTKNITINGTAYAIYTSASSLPTFVAPGSYAGTGGYILATNSTKNGLEWVAKPVSNVTTTAVVASSATGTSQITSAQTNPYYNLLEGGAVSRSIRFVAGTGITISAATDGQITITNASPDQNHNTDRTSIKLASVSGTKKTDSTLIVANSGVGLSIAGGTNLIKIGDGTNYIEVPITINHGLSTKNMTINGTAYALYTSASSLPTFVAPGAYGTANYILATNSSGNGLTWVAKPTSNVTTTAIVGNSATATSQITAAQTNPYYNLLEGGIVTRSIRFVAGNGITISAATDGLITITNSKPDVNHDTHYVTSMYIGESNDTKSNVVATNPYLKLFDNNTRRSTLRFVAGNGITIGSDASGNITITNSKPDVNHNTDRTGIKKSTVSGTKKTDATLIVANSSSGLIFEGGTNLFKIGDGTNYIEVPVTPSFTVSNKAATIGRSLTTIATINGTDITAKIADYVAYYHNANTNPNIDAFTDWAYLLTVADTGSYGGGTKASGSHNGFGVLNLHTHNGNYYTQLGLDTNLNRLWIRSANAATSFGAWLALAYTSEIPTVNNASLTLQTAGTTLTVFYANDNTNRTFNVTCANIGAATSGHNHDKRYVYQYPSGGFGNMNDVARSAVLSSVGMTSLSSSSVDNGDMSGWTHFLNISYADGGAGSNSWIFLLACPAGSSNLQFRSRNGGTITNGTAWATGWTKIAHSKNISNKDATIGTSSTTIATIAGVNITAKIGSYAASGHTHPLSIAADSGTSSIALAASTKYKLTAGGSTYVFTSTPDERVRQVPKTDNTNRPLMMINGGTSQGEQVNTSMFSTGIYANASTKTIYASIFNGTVNRTGSSVAWVNGRTSALLRETSSTGYHALWSLKTTNGSWDFGEYNTSGWYDTPVLTYITDTNFNAGSNNITYQILFPKASGTVALTSQIPTVNNASLTLLTAGTTQTTFYANDSTNRTFNVTCANIGAATSGHIHNYLSTVASISGNTHAEALKTLFTNNKANIPRNVLINYYSSAYSNGSQYFGYFLSGYDNSPYGGFFVAHYNTPYYVGITNGTFTQYQLATTSQIPTVNNASLTLLTAGTTQTTFYANDSTNRTFNVTCANIGAATSGHNHDGRYVLKSGDTMTGNLHISHAASATMNNTTTNPMIKFSESGGQAVGLVYTDYDAYRASKGLKVMDVDGSDAGNVWLEAQGCMYASHFYETSDIRLKHDISMLSKSIRKFRFNNDNKLYYGFIAQELETLHPELVDTSGEHWTVNYNSAICYYIAELENKVQKLEDEINKLKNK